MRAAWIALGSAASFLLAIGAAASGGTSATALAFLAVATAGAVLVGATFPLGGRWERSTHAAAADVSPVRDWLSSGELGREEVVRLLDRIDRTGAHPHLGIRLESEMGQFRRMPHHRFLSVVARRLDEIEGPP